MVNTDSLVASRYPAAAVASHCDPEMPLGGTTCGKGVNTHMLNELLTFVQSLTARISLRNESGQALVEYGLLVGLIAVGCIVAVTALGVDIAAAFTTISGDLAGLA